MQEDSHTPNSSSPKTSSLMAPDTAWRVLQDITKSLSGTMNDETSRERSVNAMTEMLHNLEPTDALEAQMIAQMICAHNVAMETMQHSINPEQSPTGRVIGLKLSAKFMDVFREHARALNQYRNTPEKIRERKEKKGPDRVEVFLVDPDGRRAAMPRLGQPLHWVDPDDPTLPSDYREELIRRRNEPQIG